MTDWREFDTWLVASGMTTNGTFHRTKECKTVKKPEKNNEKDEHFMRAVEPEPCAVCHPEIKKPEADREDWRRALRYEVGGDD